MFWLIENNEQLKEFYNKGYKEAYIEVIPYSYETHPVKTLTSLIYLRPLESSKGFILSINQLILLSIFVIFQLLGSILQFQTILCYCLHR